MVDRIFVWHFDSLTGDGTGQGPAFILDQDYALPGVVRLHAKRAAGYDSLQVDIKADGVSIFPAGSVPSIQKGRTIEEHWDSFLDTIRRLDRYSVLTCDVLDTGGASGITIALELEAAASEGAYTL